MIKIEFLFDSCCPCTVEISGPEGAQFSKSFSAGFGQSFSEDSWLDLKKILDQKDGLIIKIEGREILGYQGKFDIFSQRVCCTINQGAAENTENMTMVQKINYDHETFVVKEIFGLQKDEIECTICLTDRRDTILLPCRHLCACFSCAQVLRESSNKCPICRSNIRSMILAFPRQENNTPCCDNENELELPTEIDQKLNIQEVAISLSSDDDHSSEKLI